MGHVRRLLLGLAMASPPACLRPPEARNWGANQPAEAREREPRPPSTTPVAQRAIPTPAPNATHFHQGLSRGHALRMARARGATYAIGRLGAGVAIYRPPSLVDLGVGRALGTHVDGSVGAPHWVERVAGRSVAAWFLFAAREVYVNTGLDPYDDAHRWRRAAAMPWAGEAPPIEVEAFVNPQPGPFQGRTYLLWARRDPVGPGSTDVYAAEVTALSPTEISLVPAASTAANRLARRDPDGGDAAALGVAVHNRTVTVALSGDGAAAGTLAGTVLKMGQDPTRAASWMDLTHGGCSSLGAAEISFAGTREVVGPGAVRFLPSPDGREDWVVYEAELPAPRPSTPGEPSSQEQRWRRYLALQKIGWRQVTCAGQDYEIPDLGQPLPPGMRANLPGGDPGPQAKAAPYRVEAETLVPFGMLAADDAQALTISCTGVARQCSAGYAVAGLADLAARQPRAPRRAGVLLRNSPPGSGLTLAHANAVVAALDLYVDDELAATVALPAGNGRDFLATDVLLPIAAGAEVKLAFEEGRSSPFALDYIEVLPP